MGAVKIETGKAERLIDAQYTGLHSPHQVKRLLRDYHALRQRQYAGDYDAVILLTDLATAIERAGLTERQRQALTLVYGVDLTQDDAAKELGITRQAIALYVDNAAEKIAEIYEAWAWKGEGYDFSELGATE